MSRSPRAVSLPHEHGAWLTLIGSVVTGLVLAAVHGQQVAAAGGFSLCLGSAMIARSPVEQLSLGRPARLDRVALGVLALVCLAGVLLVGRGHLALAIAGAALPVLGGALAVAARRARLHRHPLLELAVMAAIGGSALPIALAGNVPLQTALLPSLVMAAHAASSVPIVRSELRPRERSFGPRADVISAVGLFACGLLVVALGRPLLALALTPRLVHLALRRSVLPPAPRPSPLGIGVREIVLLALASTVAILAA